MNELVETAKKIKDPNDRALFEDYMNDENNRKRLNK